MGTSTTTPDEPIEYEAWLATGERLFGRDKSAWKFKCPACGNVASLRIAMEKWPEAKGKDWGVEQECIGRYTDAVDCDWAAYGLFQGPVFVNSNAKIIPCFAFDEGDPEPADDHGATTAAVISAQFDDDPLCSSKNDVTLEQACTVAGANQEWLHGDNDGYDVGRFVFGDGSAIVVQIKAWDVRADGCEAYCWRSLGCRCKGGGSDESA